MNDSGEGGGDGLGGGGGWGGGGPCGGGTGGVGEGGDGAGGGGGDGSVLAVASDAHSPTSSTSASRTDIPQAGRAREQRDPEEECGVRVAARPRLSGGQVRELPFWGDCYSAELKPPV